MIQLKRAYEEPSSEDGYRVLVDRLWPRGKSKDFEELDEWLKEIAPSNELRQWFHHEPEKFPLFKEKYEQELQKEPTATAVKQLKEILATHKIVTFVYGAKDQEHNQAVVLKEWLEKNEDVF